MPGSFRERLHEIIFEADTPAGKFFDVTLLVLIILSVLAVILESVRALDARYHQVFYIIEWGMTIAFTIEYFLRIFVVRKPLRYVFSFYGIIDLLAILPTYLSLLVAGSHFLITIRILRLMRVFRVFKLTRYISETTYLAIAMRNSWRKVAVFVSSILLIVVILGSLMYLIESGQDSGFDSIPRSMYWAIVTLTTVGYGDIAPVTPLGQFVSALIMMLGYGIIAVPTGIVTAEMIMTDGQEVPVNTQSCRHCGYESHDDDAHYCKRCGFHLHPDGPPA